MSLLISSIGVRCLAVDALSPLSSLSDINSHIIPLYSGEMLVLLIWDSHNTFSNISDTTSSIIHVSIHGIMKGNVYNVIYYPFEHHIY